MLFSPFTTLFYFTFLSSPLRHPESAKHLSRLDHASSTKHGFSFIAQTFAVLFAMYQPAV